MPRSFDGPIPERPERNDISDKVGGFFSGVSGPRSHDQTDNAGFPRMDDLFDPANRPEREPRWEARERDGSGPQGNFGPVDGDAPEFMPRPGVHDQLKTVEFHNDWFFA